MTLLLLQFLSLGCVFNLLQGVNGFGMGPYDFVRVESVEVCEEGENKTGQIVIDLKMKGSAKGRVINGFWVTPYAIGEGTRGTTTIYHWLNGWRLIFQYKSGSNFCEEGMNVAPDMMKLLANRSGIPERCPFPKGRHEISGFPSQFKLAGFPNMPYGRFRMKVSLFNGNTPFGCYAGEGIINPAARKILG